MYNQNIKSKPQGHSTPVQTINQTNESLFSYSFEISITMVKSRIVQTLLAKYHIKYYSFLPVVIAAMFFCSCQKEKLSNTALNSIASSDASFDAEALVRKHKSSILINYGAQITPPPDKNYVKFQLNVAGKLGISCLRVRALVPCNSPNPLVDNRDNRYNIVLNFNRADFKGKQMSFATNLDQYKKDLLKTLSFYKKMPVVAVIENEESNRFYYSGTAQQYINQLNVAIGVMHNRGIKVANGGITAQGLKYLVYQDFLNRGKKDSAEWFKQIAEVTPNAPTTQDRGAFINTLLDAYTKMDLDYVNFHWKATSPNTDALKCVINYLQKRTRKPVISNELGQFDTDPNTLLSHIQLFTDKKCPFIIWFSPNKNSGLKETPLEYANESLTPTGKAYQNYLAD